MSDMRDSVMTRTLPMPLPNLDNHEFYEATRRGELAIRITPTLCAVASRAQSPSAPLG